MKKEVLKIATIFLITIGVVVWGLNYIFFGPAPKSKAAGETMNLSFTPATATVVTNADFTVNILAKPSINTVLRGYKVNVNFDKTKLAFKSIQYKVGIISTGLVNTTGDIAIVNGSGIVYIVGEDTTATGYTLGAANGAEIASVTFTALAAAATGATVTMTDSSFYSVNSDGTLFDTWTIAAQNLGVNGGGAVFPSPTNFTVSCPAPGNLGTATWSTVAGATNYAIRVDDQSNGWKNDCSVTQFPGDFCVNNLTTNSYTFVTATGHSYNAWVHAGDGNLGSVGVSVPVFTCPTIGTGGTTGNVNLKMKLKFQGIAKQPAAAQNSMTVKVKVQKDGESTSVDGTGTFTADATGIWTGAVGVNIPSVSGKYKIMVKGAQHIQKKVCDSTPTETAGAGLYRCSAGNVTLVAGDNNLDFSGILLLSGDLDQSGIVDSVDFGLVRNNLGKTDAATLAQADINRDGKVDTQDFSLIIAALGIRTDEL